MSRGKLYFTVGLPRSGKSTICNNWVRQNGDNPRVIVSGDDFRKALHGQNYQPESEGTVFAMMDVAAKALLMRGFDVILDETCTTEATLLRYLKIDIDASPIFVDTSPDVCVKRARDDSKLYLEGPIRRMASQLAVLIPRWQEIVDRHVAYLKSRQAYDVTC